MEPDVVPSVFYFTNNSPFPRHVQEFLYGGKRIRLVNQNGVILDLKSESPKGVLETINDKFGKDACKKVTPFDLEKCKKGNRKTANPSFSQPAERKPTILALPSSLEELDTSWDLSSEPETFEASPPTPSPRLLAFLRTQDSFSVQANSPTSPLSQTKTSPYHVSSPRSLLRMRTKVAQFPMPTKIRKSLGVSSDMLLTHKSEPRLKLKRKSRLSRPWTQAT